MKEKLIDKVDRFLAQGIEAWKSALTPTKTNSGEELEIVEISSYNTLAEQENSGLIIGVATWTEILSQTNYESPKKPKWYGSGPNDDPFPTPQDTEI